MCGLIGACSIKKKHTGHHIINLYRKQDTRGKKGFGYLAIHKGKLVGVHRSKTEEDIIKLLSKETAETILFHHRMPTSTENTLGTTHPIFVSHAELKYDYYFAHNGIITNARYLKDVHNKLGYVYNTEFTKHTVAKYADGTSEVLDEHATVFNDSETLAIEIARHLEDLSDEINTVGAAAFWGISLEKNTNNVIEVFFGKNKGRDLGFFKNNKWVGFASESGDDVEAMKIFSFMIDKPTELFERPFPIDIAEPARTVGYDRTVINNVTTPPDKTTSQTASFMPFIPADMFETRAYENLQNCFYTKQEMLESGVPEEQFFEMPIGDGYSGNGWLPLKFAGVAGRVPYGLKKPIQPFHVLYTADGKSFTPLLPGTTQVSGDDLFQDPVQSKQIELLEEYVLDYIKIEEAISNIETAYTNGLIGEHIFDRRLQDYQEHLNRIEEKFATLGLDSEVIEDKLDEGRQLIDYNNSFLPEMEGVRVI